MSTIVARISYFLKDFGPYLLLVFLAICLWAIVAHKIYKSDATQKRKKISLAAVALSLFLILGFTALESYFRYVYDVPDGLGFLNVSKKWSARHVVHNNYFYRDRNFKTEKGDSVRIGVVGDSITFGAGIEKVDDRYTNIFEKKLKDAGIKAEIYNLGSPGFDLEDEILEFEKVKHLDFDIIVWQYFLNDIQPKTKSTGTRIIETNRDLTTPIKFLTQNSYFFDFLYWRISPKYQKTFNELRQADLALYSDPLYFNRHKNLISNFTQILKEDNGQVIVVIFPFINLLGPDYPAASIHTLVGDHFKSNGVEVLDLLGDFQKLNKKELMASNFDPHPNELAHQLVAQKLFDYLKSQIN